MQSRTIVSLLEPGTAEDQYGNVGVDWNKPITVWPGKPGAVDPLSSDEAVLTAETVVSRWRCYLTAPDAQTLRMTPAWRVRWNGEDYDTDGDVQLVQSRYAHRSYLTVLLKRVDA